MGIFLPISADAQAEIHKMTLANAKTLPNGDPLMGFSKEMIIGLYFLTAEPSNKSNKYEIVEDPNTLKQIIQQRGDFTFLVQMGNHRNTAGRLLVELASNTGPIDHQLKKGDMGSLMKAIYKSSDNMEDVMQRAHDTMTLAFWAATINGGAISPMALDLPADLRKKKELALKSEDPAGGLDQIAKDFVNQGLATGSFVSALADSGAGIKGGLVQLQQAVVGKGFIEKATGEVSEKPVAGSINDGLTPQEYYLSAEGSRKGIVSRAILTADSGYLTRQLIYATNSVKSDISIKNCHTNRFLVLDIHDEKTAKNYVGRTLSNGQIINDPKQILGKEIALYSPLYCHSLGLCQCCLPPSITTYFNSKNVGFIVAQTIGEMVTQATLNAFHTGGAGASVKLFKDEDPQLEKIITQNNIEVISKVPLKIIIDSESIEKIDPSEVDQFVCKSFTIIADDLEIPIDVIYDLIIVMSEGIEVKKTGSEWELSIPADTAFISMESGSVSINDAVQLFSAILSNKHTSIEQTLHQVNEIFKAAGKNVSQWAVETLCSQLIRDPNNPAIPYRLGKMNNAPMKIALKDIAMYENWRRGSAFENISKVLHNKILNGSDNDYIQSSDLDMLIDL